MCTIKHIYPHNFIEYAQGSYFMADLNDIRTRITTLDNNLLRLLSERRELAIEVAKSKQSTSKPVRDQDREQQLLVRLINQGRELGLDSNYIMNIYHTVLEDSVLLQQAFLQQEFS